MKKEDTEYVLNKIDNEGFYYCFKHYSKFEDIDDEKFHYLRLKYLDSLDELTKYLNKEADN